MIPVRDTIQSKNFPIVNYSLIALNLYCFIVQISKGPEFDSFIYVYSLLPAKFSVPEVSHNFTFFEKIFSLFSFMFLHGGILHLLGNMWTLYIFGDNVEDRLGPLRYLMFYLLCGLSSGISHLITNYYSLAPTIGASGAVAGVMGAYFILHPKARILTIIPIFFIPYFIEIPAFIFLGIWFIMQVISAAGSQGEIGGIAWWAHIGGFISGIILLKYMSDETTSIDKIIRQQTKRNKTPRLQVIRPTGPLNQANLYGQIDITPFEALEGAGKMVNIPWGFHDRLFKVKIPPGVKEGTILKLFRQGKIMPDGERGDLFLTVRIIK